MQIELQSIDFTQQVATVPDAVAVVITTLRGEIAQGLLRHDFAKGWTRAYSLDEQSAAPSS